MARTYTLAVTANGSPVAALAVSLNLRPDGQTVATVELDPTDSDAIAVNESDSWDIALVYDVPSGGETSQALITDGRARAASYSQQFGEGLTVRRTVQITDRFAAFREYGTDEDFTRTGTDSHRELNFIAGRMGLSGAVASVDPVPIDRIDYRRDTALWETVYPYFAPFNPIIVLDPSTAALRIIDPTTVHASTPRSDRKLTLADYNPAEWSSDLRPIVTQVRVDYQAFGPARLGPKVSPSSSRVEEDVTEEDDGSMTRTWTGFRDLYENPDDPTEVTRSVVCEQGVTRTDGGRLLNSTVTTMRYRADFALLVETETVETGTVDLPLVGEYEGELERTLEEYTYEPDTIVPGRYLLKKRTATTSGIYIYTFSSADPDGSLARATATPVVAASHAGTVDVERASSGLGDGAVVVTANQSTSQQFAVGQTRVTVETYQRSHATNRVTIVGEETDSLRGKVVRTWRRTEIGDNTVTPTARTAFVWVDGSDTYGERKAAVVGAQQVGLAVGRQIAERMLAQSGQPIRSARLTLTRPDYRRYRLGWLCELDSDAPYDMAGLWLIRGVTFEAAAPTTATAPVVQSLELSRMW